MAPGGPLGQAVSTATGRSADNRAKTGYSQPERPREEQRRTAQNDDAPSQGRALERVGDGRLVADGDDTAIIGDPDKGEPESPADGPGASGINTSRRRS